MPAGAWQAAESSGGLDAGRAPARSRRDSSFRSSNWRRRVGSRLMVFLGAARRMGRAQRNRIDSAASRRDDGVLLALPFHAFTFFAHTMSFAAINPPPAIRISGDGDVGAGARQSPPGSGTSSSAAAWRRDAAPSTRMSPRFMPMSQAKNAAPTGPMPSATHRKPLQRRRLAGTVVSTIMCTDAAQHGGSGAEARHRICRHRLEPARHHRIGRPHEGRDEGRREARDLFRW